VSVRVGVIGLGIMGSAYATHLIAAGFAVTGYDVASDALQRFEQGGGRARRSPKDVAESADVIVTALATVQALESAYLSEGGIAGASAGTRIVLDAGTFALDVKERMRAGLAQHGTTMLDIPVSGTGAQAQAKDLTVFASGDRVAYETALPVMSAFARDVRYVGPFGNGSKLKYIANLLVTIHNLSTAEAVVLAQKSGIDPMLMLDALGDSAASSRMLQVRGPMMVSGAYEPATMKMDVFQKDIDIITGFAKSVDCPTPLFTQSAMFYTAALAQGRAKQDAGAIAAVLKAMAGLPPDA
jgi:putative dehydrogenase